MKHYILFLLIVFLNISNLKSQKTYIIDKEQNYPTTDWAESVDISPNMSVELIYPHHLINKIQMGIKEFISKFYDFKQIKTASK